ncbi:MAG: PD40 domain-containing protein [Pyrinomonadaceae bacterium]|nr:PD40 domain-containing protein [Sphingobacteriaceae bacterium]
MINPYLPKLAILSFSIISELSFGQQSLPKAEAFLPDIISRFPNVRDLAISPTEDEAYFTAQSFLGELSALVCIKKENGKWSNPEVASFSGKQQDLEPFFAPDGLRLYFVSNRALDSMINVPKDYDIWFVKRKDFKSKWSDPINIGAPVNTKDNEFYPAVSKSNTLYFTSDGAISKGKDDIFASKWINGKYELPHSLGDSVNTPGFEFNAFIAPDESYLLFTGYDRKDGLGSGDIYISYNKGNDQWSTSQNIGPEINSPQMDYCPFVNVKSGILYFTSKRSSVNIKLEKKQNITEILKEITKYDNGQSRLYQVKFNSELARPETKNQLKK